MQFSIRLDKLVILTYCGISSIPFIWLRLWLSVDISHSVQEYLGVFYTYNNLEEIQATLGSVYSMDSRFSVDGRELWRREIRFVSTVSG